MFSPLASLFRFRGADCQPSGTAPRSESGRGARFLIGGVERLEGRTLAVVRHRRVVTTQVNGSAASQAFALAIQPADQKIVVGGNVEQAVQPSSSPSGPLQHRRDPRFHVWQQRDRDHDVHQVRRHPDQLHRGPAERRQDRGRGNRYVFTNRPGLYESEFVLARYNASGSLDSTFGTGGKVTTSFSHPVAKPGSTPSCCGRTERSSPWASRMSQRRFGSSVALSLYKANGALDTSFGSSGTVVDTSLNTSTSSTNSAGGSPPCTTISARAAGPWNRTTASSSREPT